MKRPAFQFYPGDWRKDVELRACSLAARGLWIDLMCVAHECEPYGHLVLNNKPMTMQQMAGQIGVPGVQVKKLLEELLESGVARQTPEGVIYSKRMVEDERVRNVRAEGGKAGAEHGAKGGSHGSKGGRPPKPKGGFETPLQGAEEPPPSSSSSSSPSGDSEANASAGKPALEPAEIIFGYGLPLLTNAGTPEKQARSFLGALRKRPGGDAAVVNAIRDCLREKPLQPLEWLAAALPPAGSAKAKAEPMSYADRDRINGQLRWEEMTGQRHPALEKLREAGEVIDVLPTTATPRIEHVAAH
ncbi:hypothetical protein [Pseudorhodoferax sp. Leaf274]|uniref:hypothetical protein n=1 Tax=Pseudorhodoferax sp. Leaf274 TaxID=1736318 RepID=UPI0012E2C92D|nr:hypothetical protein [Pseudorhodoferax sp. Leaf274]